MDVPNGSVSSVYLAVDSVALHCDHWCAISECAVTPLAFTLAFHRVLPLFLVLANKWLLPSLDAVLLPLQGNGKPP